MIEINLLPQEYRKKEGPKISLPAVAIGKTIVVAMGIFFVVQLGLAAFAVSQHVSLGATEREVERLTAENREIARHKDQIEFVRKRMLKIDQMTARPFYWAKLLNGLSDSVIKGVWLNEFSLIEVRLRAEEKAENDAPAEGDKPKRAARPKFSRQLNLAGSVVGQGDETAYIGKFIQELKENPELSQILDSIELSDIMQKRVQETDVYDFLIICGFKKEKTPPA